MGLIFTIGQDESRCSREGESGERNNGHGAERQHEVSASKFKSQPRCLLGRLVKIVCDRPSPAWTPISKIPAAGVVCMMP